MELKDIKDGMVIEIELGILYLKIKDRFVRDGGFLLVKDYYEYLESKDDSLYDIVAVYESNQPFGITDLLNKDYLAPIWKKKVKVTKEKAEEMLRKFGEEVEIE